MYRPRKLTLTEKQMATFAQAIDPDRLEEEIKQVAARHKADLTAYHRMQQQDCQDAITADSLAALRAVGRSLPSQPRPKMETPMTEHTYTPTNPDARPVVDAVEFVLGGNAYFTVVSKRTGARFTFRVARAEGEKEDRPWFVSVLTGSDNTTDYTYLGTIFADGAYRHGKKSRLSYEAASAKAARWFFTNLRDETAMAQCEVWHEGRCCVCGRRLTVPSSIEAGIGPDCAGRV